jgi:glycerol-3-phosphate cytidylyltransferase-like family protein
MTLQERWDVVAACKYVDRVMVNTDGADSKPAILESQADLIVIGSDWARRDYHKQMGFTQDWLDEYGIGLAYIPYTRDISSTIIKQRLSRG